MRILIMSLCFLIVSISAYAGEFFKNSDIRDIRILSINTDVGTAVLKDLHGSEAVVSIGDMVGVEGGTVVNIDQSSITIQAGNTNTKIPAKHAVCKPAGS